MGQAWTISLASARVRVLPYPYIMKQTPTRQVRKAMQLTQAEFAEKLGVAKQTIVDIEGRRKGYQDRIPLKLAKRIGFLSGVNPLSLVDQIKGAPKALGAIGPSDNEHWEEAEQSGLSVSIAKNVAHQVASAMISAEDLGVRDAHFLAFEIEELIMSHVSAWGVRNAPPGAFAPALRKREACRRPDSINLGPLMGEHSVAVARLKRQSVQAGLPAGDLDLLNPVFLIQLADEFSARELPKPGPAKGRLGKVDRKRRARETAAAALQRIARFLRGEKQQKPVPSLGRKRSSARTLSGQARSKVKAEQRARQISSR
jgi:DNA-binding XRE family transcriptional regulator